jgi:uncharacterized membrane protein
VKDPSLRLERAIEVALSGGVLVSGLLLLSGLVAGSHGLLRSGVVLLMLTPVARVLVLTVGLFHERDFLFGALSLWVLAVLASGIWVSVHL